MQEQYKPPVEATAEHEKASVEQSRIVETEERITAALAPLLRAAEIKHRPGGGPFISLRAESLEQQQEWMVLFEMLGIFPWDNEDLTLSIENAYDLRKLEMLGLVVLSQSDDVDLDEALGADDVRFPLPKRDTPSVFAKNEFQTNPFTRTKEEDDFKPYFGDTTYLLREAQKKYKWQKGKLWQAVDGKWQEYDRTQEKLLFLRAQEGDRAAREELLALHTQLVYFAARNFNRIHPLADTQELLQEGMIQLDTCIDRYDGRGAFSTYAMVSLDGTFISWYRDHQRNVHRPNYTYDVVRDLRTVRAEQPPTATRLQDLAQAYRRVGAKHNLSPKLLQALADIARTDPMNEIDIDEVEETPDESSLIDEQPLPFERVLQRHTRAAVEQALSMLTPREAKILRLRFGMNTREEGYSYEAIAQMFDVTGERIRQIEQKALRSLRRLRFSPPFSELLE